MCLEDLLIRQHSRWTYETKVVAGAGSGLLIGPDQNRIALNIQLTLGTPATTFLGPGTLPEVAPVVGMVPTPDTGSIGDKSVFGMSECPWWFVVGGAATFLIASRIMDIPLEELVAIKNRMWLSRR